MDCYSHHHEMNYGYLMTLLGVIVGAVLAYVSQSLLLKQQHKKDVERMEGEIINEAVFLLSKSQHEINYFMHKRDKDRFEREFESSEHFPTLGKIIFQLRRLTDKKIREKFEEAYKACGELGFFVMMYPDPQSRDLKTFKELIAEFSKTKTAFEEYCAEYSKLKK